MREIQLDKLHTTSSNMFVHKCATLKLLLQAAIVGAAIDMRQRVGDNRNKLTMREQRQHLARR
jgi:hypothetical protein